MKNKITILIITSILALIALSSIQGYLIYNTYQLKRSAFIKETDDAMSDIHLQQPLDDLFDNWGEDLKNHLADYKNDRISKDEVIRRLTIKADSNNIFYNKVYKEELEKLAFGYDVNYKTILKDIVIIEGSKRDTIVKSASNTRLFGQAFDSRGAIVINKSRWYSEHDFIQPIGDDIQTSTYNLEVKTEQLILIKDWKSIVFKRMALLLFASLLLFLFVIGLLYYSIKNLITQKKITEVKTDFINNITHELKTPLATLSIATKSLKNKNILATPEALNNTVEIVERQNNRLQKLIDQVLTNSLSSKELVLSKEHIIDNEYFTNLISDFKLSVQHTSLNIKNEVYAPEVMLRIDKFHFTTALLNILENAVKYGNDNIEIILKTELKNGNYCIAISDNGNGISEKNQKQIFDKFYRVIDGNVHDVKGLGLGLYYTSQIINAHQGTITTESELKKGTRFQIKIPVN